MTPALLPAYLDSSFIVRYLTNDPAEMAERAAAVIDSDQILTWRKPNATISS
jgi:hypothetical protein